MATLCPYLPLVVNVPPGEGLHTLLLSRTVTCHAALPHFCLKPPIVTLSYYLPNP